MAEKQHWLHFLGKRRPTTVADDHRAWREPETKSRTASPRSHRNPKGIEGHALGRGVKGNG